MDVAISKYLRVRPHTILLVMTSPLYFSFFSLTTFVALVQSGIVWHLMEHQIEMTLSEIWLLARSMVVALGVESRAFTIGSEWKLKLDIEFGDDAIFLCCVLDGTVRSVCRMQCPLRSGGPDRRGIVSAHCVDAVGSVCIFLCVVYIFCILNHIMSAGLV